METQELIKTLQGKTEKEAQAILKETYFTSLRVMKINGQGLMGTCDYRHDRINVELVEDRIVDAWVG
jgi:hypothetical protein